MRDSVIATAFLLAALLAPLAPAAPAEGEEGPADLAERLWRHRNLGKAFYENPATQYEAVEELRKALELAPDSARERLNFGMALFRAGRVDDGIAELERAQKADPSIPHTWFNLGIAYSQASRYSEALAQLQRMAELVPDEPITHYNLGVLYNLEGKRDNALAHFRRSAELDPNLAGPHFQLSNLLRRMGDLEAAKAERATFLRLKKQNESAPFPEDLEWSWYSELYEELEPEAVRERPPAAELAFHARTLGEGLEAATAGLAVLDADADGREDLLAHSARGVRLFVGGREAAARLGPLAKARGVRAVAPGDFDNDGRADLCVLTERGASLYRGGAAAFERLEATLPAGPFRAALWLDYDHDYDLDLFLLGKGSRLLRNRGDGSFDDRSADFPFAAGEAIAASRIDTVADTQGMDLAVAYRGRGGVLYHDRLGGRYEPEPLPALAAGRTLLAAHDLDHDGWTDLLAAGSGGLELLLNERGESFRAVAGPAGAAAPAVVADLENRGVSELAAGGEIYRNLGLGRLGKGESAGLPTSPVALAEADFDADGWSDLAAVDGEGRLLLLRNATETENRWLRVGLEGVKNLALAPGAEVEVKAGRLYQKKIYRGAPLHFGLGGAEEVDTVRITWPNGLIQNEARQKAGRLAEFAEAQRLSGSCPMIFTWNGREFEFITDVLGVAPLGAAAGDGEYFPVDHDEVIQIAGEQLVPRRGGLEVRITEELREVAFLDEIRLIAVDHAEGVEIFTNDKFKGPPFPEHRLFGVEERLYPLRARDHRGEDVLDRILARDRRYPDAFERDYAGVAEEHSIELDFGAAAPEGEALLVLSGWVDWADGSTFLGASQRPGHGLVPPYLQVRDEAGAWRTVVEDMGLPAGKPKTIVVDLTGKFLSASREVRIVTNLCLYWDEIFLAEESGEPEVVATELHAEAAMLRFRGFSGVVIHPERKQPEYFVYAERRPTSMWNPTPGLYTRYGDVRELLGEIDDRFVIMGSGDELVLSFPAGALPPLAAGQRRDYLLFVDGWAKDGDANTAHSQTVEPLPFHGMPQYPYSVPHSYPEDGPRKRYREHYNTRPALRLIRPLAEAGIRGARARARP